MRILTTLILVSALLAQQPLTNEDVLKMSKAGMSEELLLSMIQQNPGNYTTTADGVIALKGAGVSDKVITAMVNRNAPPKSEPTTRPTVPNGGKLKARGFKFQRGQSVYVVAMETESRDLSKTKGNLEIERRARDEFRHKGSFELVGGISQADFVFVVLIDATSRDIEEIGVAVSPEDYQNSRKSMDSLRDLAIWQDSNRYPRAKVATAILFTGGLSNAV